MKNLLLSKTVIGAIIQIVATILTTKGLLQNNEFESIIDNIDVLSGSVLTGVGFALTVYGRMKANKKIYFLKKK